MTARRETRSEMHVVGHQARTTNQREADPGTARIPGLWAQAPGLARAVGPGRLSAVYHEYETDNEGAYTIVVGVEVPEPQPAPAGLVAVTAPAAECLVYPARGPMPDAVVAAWREVWADFPSGSDGRAYTADVEIYDANGADVYIAVKPAG